MLILLASVTAIAAFWLWNKPFSMKQLAQDTLRRQFTLSDEEVKMLAATVNTRRQLARLVRRLEFEQLQKRVDAALAAIYTSSPETSRGESDPHAVAIAVIQLYLNSKRVHPALAEFATTDCVVDRNLLLGIISRKVNHTSTFDRGHRFDICVTEYGGLEVREYHLFVDWKWDGSCYLSAGRLPDGMLAQFATQVVEQHNRTRGIAGVSIGGDLRLWMALASSKSAAA